MQALHLQLAGHAHHVAGGVQEAAHPKIQLVVESCLAPAVVAAGGCRPVLRASPAAAVMVPCALPVVFAPEFTHLLRQQHLVQIVHLLVRAPVVVFHVRMIVDCPSRIQLESLHPLIHESGQMIHPVFFAGSVPALAQSHIVLLGDAQVVILAKP